MPTDSHQFSVSISTSVQTVTKNPPKMKKCTVAILLIVATVTSAEPPRGRGFPRGSRLRSQKQQLPPTPAASYGPPPQQEYGPPAEPITTTTETIETTTTLEAQAESFQVAPSTAKQQVNPGSYYVVVPQFYTASPAIVPSARLISPEPRLVPVQAVPALAKIQDVPQAVAAVPAFSSGYTSIVNTPYSSTFVQSFQ